MALTTSFSLNNLFSLKTLSQPFQSLHQSTLLQVTPKTTISSSFFPRFITSVPKATVPSTTTPPMTDSESDTDHDELMDAFNSLAKIFNPSVVRVYEHPFVTEGSKDLFLVTQDNEGYYLRIDLPGVEKECVNLCIDKDFLCIEGVEANKDPDFDKESARKYQKRFSFPVAYCKIGEIKVQVKGGVVRVIIPKLKIQEKEGVVKVLVN